MIRVEIEAVIGNPNKTSVYGTICGNHEVLIHELCTFFETIEKSRGELIFEAMEMYLTESIKNMERDYEE